MGGGTDYICPADLPEETAAKVQEAALKANTWGLKKRQAEAAVRTILEAREDSAREMRQLEEQVKDIRFQKEAISGEMTEIEWQNGQSESAVQDYNQKLEEEKTGRDRLAAELTEAQMEGSKLAQQAAFVRENAERIRQEKKNLELEQETLLASEGQGDTAVLEKQQQIGCLKEEIRVTDEKIAALNDRLAENCRRAGKTGRPKQKRIF